LERFSSGTIRIHGFVVEDAKKKEVLERVEGMLAELSAMHKTVRQLKRNDKWSAGDEENLAEAAKAFEDMKSEAMRCQWADAKLRNRLRGVIRRLGEKEERTPEDEGKLEGTKKALEDMKSEAMRLPWYDAARRGALRKTIRKLEEKKKRAAENGKKLDEAMKPFEGKKTEILRCLWANVAIFYPGRAKPSNLYGDYGWIHRHIKNDNLKGAGAKISDFKLFLDSNKPRFILDELSKMPDSYLAPVIAELAMALPAFEAQDLKEAQRHFALAAVEMRKIAYPEKA
jgi:hypothetical protein